MGDGGRVDEKKSGGQTEQKRRKEMEREWQQGETEGIIHHWPIFFTPLTCNN